MKKYFNLSFLAKIIWLTVNFSWQFSDLDGSTQSLAVSDGKSKLLLLLFYIYYMLKHVLMHWHCHSENGDFSVAMFDHIVEFENYILNVVLVNMKYWHTYIIAEVINYSGLIILHSSEYWWLINKAMKTVRIGND